MDILQCSRFQLSPHTQIRIHPRINLIPGIRRMRAEVRGALHRPPMINIGIKSRVKLVANIRRMWSVVGRALHCSPVIGIRVKSRINLVPHIRRMWSVVGRALHRPAVINIRIKSRVDLVANIRRMRSVVRRDGRRGFALCRSVHTLAAGVNRCDARAGTVVVAVLHLVDAAGCDVLVAGGGFVVAGCRVDGCVYVAADGFAGALGYVNIRTTSATQN